MDSGRCHSRKGYVCHTSPARSDALHRYLQCDWRDRLLPRSTMEDTPHSCESNTWDIADHDPGDQAAVQELAVS